MSAKIRKSAVALMSALAVMAVVPAPSAPAVPEGPVLANMLWGTSLKKI
ncbi:hypothetical protein [Herbidospora sp. RD11066]